MVKGDTAGLVKIRPELADLGVPIDQVSAWPRNPRRGDIDKLKQSLRQHGQYAPLLVQASTGHVVKGNNTLIAMRDLGAKHVAVKALDLDDDQARTILLLDNKTSDEAEYDEGELTALLASFGEAGSLADTGWNDTELDNLLRTSGQLSDAATEFLTPVIAAAPDPAAAALSSPVPADPATAAAATTPAEVMLPPAPAASAPAGEPQPATVRYVQLSWTCTVAERDRVREAIKLAQSVTGSSIAVEALLTITEHYLATAGQQTGVSQ